MIGWKQWFLTWKSEENKKGILIEITGQNVELVAVYEYLGSIILKDRHKKK